MEMSECHQNDRISIRQNARLRFIAWLSLDQRRIEGRRDGFVPCVVRSNFVPPAFSQTEWGKVCMGQLARLLGVPLVKVGKRCLEYTGRPKWL